MITSEYDFHSLTERILGAVFEVSNTLGAGFLEKVYERSLLKELSLRNIRAIAQAPIPVLYKEHPVGEFFADILVENVLVIELKCADRLPHRTHGAMHKLPKSIRPHPLSPDKFPKTQSRVEAYR